MARLDWDRLRRVRPLDGADARIDPDGGVVWEREKEEASLVPLGARRLRAGIVVRRAKERTAASGAAVVTEPEPAAAAQSTDAPVLEACPRCGAMVSRRRLVRHVRVACRGGAGRRG